VQESVTNALRHADARRIDIALHAEAETLRVTISDDGIGLPRDWQQAGHYGLRGIAERAQALGGVTQIGRREPRGTVVDVRLPLQR